METEKELDWDFANEMLTECETTYKELVGQPGVNPWFVLGSLASLRDLYDSGERTEKLYSAIKSEYEAM